MSFPILEKDQLIDKTIAVLPFVNMSSSEDNEFFSDGITEEIINALAKIGNLKVTSRTSSFFFKGKNEPISEIGDKLNVSTILEGSVRLSGDAIRVTAQLIQVQDDFHFWSETWDRKLENIFAIQDEISLLIADKLREHFGHFEVQEHLVSKQTDNIDAYEYSLKALYHANKWNPEDVKKAIALYEKALELDPNHTESHIGLADCYSFLGTTSFMPFEEAWGNTIKYTNQAHALNNKLSGVQYQLSNQAFFIECDYNKSLELMKKAIAISPNSAKAQQFLSFLYILSGDKVNALKHLNIAIGINPLSEETQFFYAYYHYMVEDYDKALLLLDKCIKANSKNIPAHAVKSICLLKMGRFQKVINYFDTLPQEIVILGEKTGAIGLAHALNGDKENTANYLKQLTEQAAGPNGFTADSFLFFMHVVSGNKEKAFEWIENAIKSKSALLLLRFSDPLVNSIKSDPRYEQFKKVIFKLTEAPTKTKGKKNLLDEESAAAYASELLKLLAENESFLDPNLSLRTLAAQLGIHPNQLSWLLNENLGKNFNEFINQYRIAAFKTIAKNPKNANITIMGLAYDCGFNSKTVFNTYFKKETGQTPKQFLSQKG